MKYWARVAIALAMLGGLALLACLASCVPADYESNPASRYGFECTVDRVEGTFYSYRTNIRTNDRMITMYRVTNGKHRRFMFPAERVQCAETL